MITHQNREKHHPTSRTDTFRSADLSSLFTTPEEAAFENRHSELLQSIHAQRELVEQAAAAIAFCRKKYSYNGTLQELSTQRLLLISQERLSLYNRQMDELKDHRYASNFIVQPKLDDIPESLDFETDDGEEPVVAMSCTSGQIMLYSLFIDKFLLHLNPSFCMKKIDKDSSYAFVVLCRYGDYIHATQVANVLDIGELRNNKVKIKELIVFDGIPPDFCVMVEVFAMKISKRMDHKWQSVWDFAARTFRGLKRVFTPSSNNTNVKIDLTNKAGQNKNVSTIGASFSASSVLTQQQTPISSDFRRCGYLHLNRDKLGPDKEKFFLSDADYPLEGTIEVFARCAATDSPMAPPRPDSADHDLRMVVNSSTFARLTAVSTTMMTPVTNTITPMASPCSDSAVRDLRIRAHPARFAATSTPKAPPNLDDYDHRMMCIRPTTSAPPPPDSANRDLQLGIQPLLTSTPMGPARPDSRLGRSRPSKFRMSINPSTSNDAIPHQ